MPFDPSLPAPHSPLESQVVRDQLQALFNLITSILTVQSAQVDAVTTGGPGDPAGATAQVIGSTLHFSFSIPRGNDGAQGPPFATAVVDSVTTLPAGSPATVSVSFDGSNVRFTFGLPQGEAGIQGFQGPPGEVSNAQLDAALALKAQNPSAVNTIPGAAPASYDQAQIQQLIDKVNELINALR